MNEAGNAIVGGADMGNTVMLTWPEVQRGTDSLAELYFIGYQVTYNSQGSRGKRATNGDIFTTNNSVTLMDLDFYSNYTYTIAAEYSHMPTNMLLGRVNGPTGTFQTGEGRKLLMVYCEYLAIDPVLVYRTRGTRRFNS